MSKQPPTTSADGTPSARKPDKKGSFICLRFAKKLRGLFPAEIAVLTAICDHAGTPYSVCTASIDTLSRETGHATRKLQYGLHGRKGMFSGIAARKLVKAENATRGGRHVTTHWKPVLENFISLLPDEDATELRQLLERVHRDEEKGAQDREKGCTSDEERVHRDEEKGANTHPSSKENSKENSPTNLKALDGWMEKIWSQRHDSILGCSESELVCLPIENVPEETVREAFFIWLRRPQGFDGLKNPVRVLLKEFPACLERAKAEAEARARIEADIERQTRDMRRQDEERLARKRQEEAEGEAQLRAFEKELA